MTEAQASAAVDEIIDDLSDRSGLKQEWQGFDAGIQAEIRHAWAAIILRHGTQKTPATQQ